MKSQCHLSKSRLGLLYVAAMVLGADLILLCWRFADAQSLWVPALGGIAMLCTSCSVVLSATKREGMVYPGGGISSQPAQPHTGTESLLERGRALHLVHWRRQMVIPPRRTHPSWERRVRHPPPSQVALCCS